MRKLTTFVSLAGLGFASLAWSASATPIKDLTDANPGVRVYAPNGKISRIYGSPMSTGFDVFESADTFLRDHADVFDLKRENLVLKQNVDGWDITPVMYNQETGDFKFYAMYYAQVHEGLPVYGGEITLLFRNEPGFPLVHVVNNVKSVSGLEVNPDHLLPPNHIGRNGLTPEDRDEMQQVVYINPHDGEGETAVVAYSYVTVVGQPGQPVKFDVHGHAVEGAYDRRLVFVDATTGELLHSESLIRTVDVEGNVQGWATPGVLPDTNDNPEELMPLPNVTVQIVGGNSAETDDNGDYVIPYGGGSEVTVRSRMVGPSLSLGVDDQAGGELLIDQNVTPPGPADFEHNTGKTEYDTAEVNAMLHTSIIHTFLNDVSPGFPGWSRGFRANVNIGSTCNAYYDGSSINFYRAGGGCVNTAYTSVIYHEYGHKIVDDGASSPSGDYHEGMADCLALVLLDDPITGRGFSGPGTYVRTAINNRSYPCSGQSHYCGQVLSGCVWDTREALFITEPDEYLTIIRDLTVNSVLLHAGGIDPGITIDFLTLDDNDGDIGNGTPHYNEINTGFSNHNMDAPPIEFLDFSYPNGQPETIDPAGGTTMRVVISSNVSDPEPGSGMLHYNDGNGWNEIAMNDLGNDAYDAVFPAVDCPSVVQYYISAETTDNVPVYDPAGAPTTSYSTIGAVTAVEVFADDFETNKGWSVVNESLADGAWERGVPAGLGDRGDPTEDFDGSGACYLTDNVAGNSDVDGGPTRLISPVFDMSLGDGFVSYARWFYNDDNDADRLVVEISNNGGSNWTTVESVSNTGGWVSTSFLVSDYVAPTSTMQMRFSATDNPNDSVTEAAIDAFQVMVASCAPPDGMLLEIIPPLTHGEQSRISADFADPGKRVFFAYSLAGTGDTYIPQLDVTLGITNPKLIGSAVANGSGYAAVFPNVPKNTVGLSVWVQAAHYQKVSNVINQVIQ